ncbi:MAG: hypothetical protein LPJ89_04250 [Hymenobacteraceae bacterium]|nr:hypothetical protein [Hymenobacteraceae bacterium]MDX5396272.1 hypothetical protein [Hymenobacteraceae bacterium]MDX5442976.1 hypothetical protein [Hymenobacteraceae bacterium]MDX5512333.1 hypothetical protein [Hymenobacteraceae bacterium]
MENCQQEMDLFEKLAEKQSSYKQLQQKFLNCRQEQLKIKKDQAFPLWRELEEKCEQLLLQINALAGEIELLQSRRQYRLF